MTTIADVLTAAWEQFLDGFQTFLPGLLAMLSLVAVGLVIAWVMAVVLRQVLRVLRFDRLADRSGATGTLRRLALPPASDLAASLVFWLVFAAFLVSGLSALGFSGLEHLVADFVAFLPRLGVGVVMLVAGLVAANFAWRATLLGAVNAGWPSARLVSGAVRWLIIVVAVAMALEQIGVATSIMLTAFAIAFGAVMLGIAIAIGIGGGPVARRLIERQFADRPARPEPGQESEELSHL